MAVGGGPIGPCLQTFMAIDSPLENSPYVYALFNVLTREGWPKLSWRQPEWFRVFPRSSELASERASSCSP